MSVSDGTRAQCPGGVRLAALVDRLRTAGLLLAAPAADAEIRGISDDSRRIQTGDLYCAWPGTAVDGHEFVVASQGAGAVATIVERPVPEATIPQVLVRDGRRAAAVAAAVVLGDPQASLRLIAVTGTNGKTTTVWILRHLLSSVQPSASIGTLGAIVEDGSTLPGSENLTTPGPVELARTLRLLVDRGVRAVAMETSSHALHQGRAEALRFEVAVFTNLSRDHLDYHGTFEEYHEAKLGLADLLEPSGVAVVNADDPAWADVRRRVPRTLSFGIASQADLVGGDVALAGMSSRYTCRFGGKRVAFELPLPSAFNVQNALAATTAALALGFTLPEVAARLRSVPQVPGRLERIADSPCLVLRDYSHTPDSLHRALQAMRPLTRGRLIVVFGAGGDRDRGKRPLMGAAAQNGSDLAIVTSDNPRTEVPERILDEIVAGMTRGQYTRLADRRAAIAHALEVARPDDVILLAGKGHETYQVVGTEKLPFDEREVVSQLLGGATAGAVR